MHAVLSTVRRWFSRRKRLRELDEEMATHFDLLVEEGRRQGLDTVEARRRARLAFGGDLATREATAEAFGWSALESWTHDLRIAARNLVRRPGFSLGLIAILALGIGATTAIFTLMRGVLWQALPVSHPSELHVALDPDNAPYRFSAPTVTRLENDPTLRGQVIAYADLTRLTLRVGSEAAEPISAQFVNGRFFSALGVPTARGRWLADEDNRPGQPQAVAVVSWAWWMRRFGGAADVVGRTVLLNGEPVGIVGVAPETFSGVTLGDSPDLWLPAALHARLRVEPSAAKVTSGAPITTQQWMTDDRVGWLNVLLRQAPDANVIGAALAAATQPQLATMVANVSDAASLQTIRDYQPQLRPAAGGFSHQRNAFHRAGLTLTLLTITVVLVTVANSSTLLFLRMLGRRRELGVRVALGSSRWRLARGALMESALLAVGGAVVGLALGGLATPLLADWLAPGLPAASQRPDLVVLLGLAGLVITLGLALGAAPAWVIARLSPQSALQARQTNPPGSLMLGRGLIVAQLALSVLLVAVACTLAFDLRQALGADLGFNRTNVVSTTFSLEAANLPAERQPAILAHLREAALALPQVLAVGFSSNGALSGSRTASGLYFRDPAAHTPDHNVQHEGCDEHYLDALGVTLLRGRGLAATDRADTPRVAVISQTLARQVFGEKDPIGQHFGFGPEADAEDWEIVGVVADARINGVRDAVPPVFYTPLTQWERSASYLAIRVIGDGAPVRELLRKTVSAAEPGLLFGRWLTIEERIDRWVRNDRVTVVLTGSFAGLASLLAGIGTLGALGHLVASRSHEIAVRLAIGAAPRAIWSGIVLDALKLGAAGSVVGTVLALAVPRLLTTWMITGPRADHTAILCAAVAGLIAAALGGLLPARRAARVDPLVLLRSE